MNQSETTSAAGGVTLTDLHAANIARQAEWCPNQLPDLSFRGNELAGETGEACNVIKKLERERQGWRGSRATLGQLAEELADVVICADLCAVTAGIDLDAAVRDKFNATSEKVGLTTKLAAAPSPPAGGGETEPYGGPGIRDPLVEIVRKPGKEPCGECHIRPGETCDICGAKAAAEQSPASPADELAKLSERATPDEWRDASWGEGNQGIIASDGGSFIGAHDSDLSGRPHPGKANAAFVVALVNAYRSGRLVEATPADRGETQVVGHGWLLIPEQPLPEMMGAFWRTKNTGTTEIGGEHKDSSDVAAFRAYAAAAPKPEATR